MTASPSLPASVTARALQRAHRSACGDSLPLHDAQFRLALGWCPEMYVAASAAAEHAVTHRTYAAQMFGRLDSGRDKAASVRLVARQLSERAAAWSAAGDSAPVVAAWLPIAASATRVEDWLTLALPDTASGGVPRADYWSRIGPHMGPLAWAAGMGVDEAALLTAQGRLEEESLKAFAALEGRLVPGRWYAL